MPRLTTSLPKYRKHKASGQAIVNLDGSDFYLGPYGSQASRREYDRLVGEWQQNGRRLPPRGLHNELATAELLNSYHKFAEGYYVKNGRPTSAIHGIRAMLKLVRKYYGDTQAVEFGPLALKSLQARMIEAGASRRYINEHTQRIRRMFKWAASNELIPFETYQRLTTVDGLRKGRTKAREIAPVLPVDDSTVDKTLAHLSAVVGDMVRFQRLTGCRPGEVCILRPYDVETDGDVWTYRPASHKTEHHGRERVVFIGPKAQDVLRPYLLREKTSYCFSPIESENRRRQRRHEQRTTPLPCGNRPGTNRKRRSRRSAGERYNKDSYRRAIVRACDKAGIDRWSPNRLRHSAATEIRRRFGLEAAQVALGHSNADVTQIYAERDFSKAAEIARQVG